MVDILVKFEANYPGLGGNWLDVTTATTHQAVQQLTYTDPWLLPTTSRMKIPILIIYVDANLHQGRAPEFVSTWRMQI